MTIKSLNLEKKNANSSLPLLLILVACQMAHAAEVQPHYFGASPGVLTNVKARLATGDKSLLPALKNLLKDAEDDLWKFELPDGRGIRKAVAYLHPYLADKSKWPLKPDVQAWEGWPTRQSSLLFAGCALDEPEYLDLWLRLRPDPTDDEVQRNIAITQPLLWVP
jgi:hypothetical protein